MSGAYGREMIGTTSEIISCSKPQTRRRPANASEADRLELIPFQTRFSLNGPTEMVSEHKPEIELDTSFDEWLRHTVEVLCAKRPPLFRFERELRLCQLKAWLLDDVKKDLISVRRTAMTFAAARLAARTNKIRRTRPQEPPSSRLMMALRDPDLGILFDFAFPSPFHLYTMLLQSLSFKDVSYWAEKVANDISCLNELTRWRLRLAKTEGFKPTLNAGLYAYKQSRASGRRELPKDTPDKKRDKKHARTTLSGTHRARARREAFLFVATTECRDILEITPNAAKMLRLLEDQAKQTELFKGYLARCQTALELLQEKNPSAATLRGWSGVDAIPLSEILPITKEEQESLGLYPEGRRSAKTTKRAKRQKPM